jgi:hypothetical protein
MHLVRDVIATSSSATSMRYVSGSMSTNCGRAPVEIRRNGWNRSVRHRDHFVIEPNFEGFECEEQGIGPTVHAADTKGNTTVFCKTFLKRFNARTKNKPSNTLSTPSRMSSRSASYSLR